MNARHSAKCQINSPGTMERHLSLGQIGAEPVSLVCRLRTPEGTYRWVELRLDPISDAEGQAYFSSAA